MPDRRRRHAQRPARREPVDSGGGWTGTEFEVTVGPVAHGGHCVARREGRVVFVRHTLPGERVRVRVTEDRHAGEYDRAVEEASREDVSRGSTESAGADADRPAKSDEAEGADQAPEGAA